MGNLDYKGFTKRHRPHIHPPDSVLFVTYRLAGSIPRPVVRAYKARKDWLEDQLAVIRKATLEDSGPEIQHWLKQVEDFNRAWFVKFEEIMHKANTGPMWIKNENVAESVASSLQKLNGTAYRLDAYSVMSNHVHAVFKPCLSEKDVFESVDESGRPIFVSKHPGLSRIMQSLKGASSRECNRILARTGPGSFGSTRVLTTLFVKENSTKRSGTCLTIPSKQVWSNIGKNGVGATAALSWPIKCDVRQTLVCRYFS